MDARDKLRKYLDDNGVQYKWFAEKIGMHPKVMYMVLSKKKMIPRKYWKEIIITTNKQISLYDLAEIDLDEQQSTGNKKYKK